MNSQKQSVWRSLTGCIGFLVLCGCTPQSPSTSGPYQIVDRYEDSKELTFQVEVPPSTPPKRMEAWAKSLFNTNRKGKKPVYVFYYNTGDSTDAERILDVYKNGKSENHRIEAGRRRKKK